jgi:hypothetical protein
MPRGAKLREVDDRPGSTGKPITEALYAHGGGMYRVRVLELGDRAKITVSEASDANGDVAQDERGGRIIFQQPAVGGALVFLSGDAAQKQAAIDKAVVARVEAAARAGAMRRGVRRLLGLSAAPDAPCPTCGGDPPVRDVTATATHKDANDLVVRSPNGYWVRLRFTRVPPPENHRGEASADWVHIMVSSAQAKDESGDIVEDDRGHRIFGGTVHSIPLHALVADASGRPSVSIEALIADRLATYGLNQAEANIAQRDVLASLPASPDISLPPKPDREAALAAELEQVRSVARSALARADEQVAALRQQLTISDTLLGEAQTRINALEQQNATQAASIRELSAKMTTTPAGPT